MPDDSPSPFTANSASTSATTTVAPTTPAVSAVAAIAAGFSGQLTEVELAKDGVAKPRRIVIRGKISA